MKLHPFPYPSAEKSHEIRANQQAFARVLKRGIRNRPLVNGLDNLLPATTPTALVFKHIDNADPLQGLRLVNDAYDGQATFVPLAKHTLFKPVIGNLLRNLGVVPVVQSYRDSRTGVDRTSYSTELTRTSAEALYATENGKLTIWPEGHRVPHGVGPIRSGVVYAMAEFAQLTEQEGIIEIIGQACTRVHVMPIPRKSAGFALSVSEEPIVIPPIS